MSLIADRDKIKRVVSAAAGVIVKEGDNFEKMLLLIQRDENDHWPGHWEFPRGKCDKPIGEDLVKCCKREIKEETGLDVEPVYIIDKYEYIADQGTRKTICYNFYCTLKNPNQKVKLSNEHQAFRWITAVGISELLVHPDQKKTISKAFNREKPIMNIPDNKFSKNNQLEEYLNLLQEENPCWKGYEMVGMKREKGKLVPNCVPIKEEKENKPLNKPFRISGGNKKFGVYVKNDKGNVVLVKFGDPNMEIKRDDPERRKSFRARHNCDNPGPKWKARFWSCKMWEKKKSVGDYLKG
jgi:8-oxo-dGTP diphosphatase